MNHKRTVAILIILLSTFLYAENHDGLSLGGMCSYQFSLNNKRCEIKVESVVNNSDTSSTFEIAFFLCDTKYYGTGNLDGYEIGREYFSTPLESKYQRNNINFTITKLAKSQPPSGSYYPVIVLLGTKYRMSDSKIIDYFNFSDRVYFSNSFEPEVNKILNEIERVGYWEQKYWKDVMVAYSEFASTQWKKYSDELSELRNRLMQLGCMYSYLDSDGKPMDVSKNYIMKKTTVNPYVLTNTYASESTYTPSYSLPSPDYSSSSSSSSEMRKVRVTCSSCNGTGKDSSRSASPDYVGRSRPYCDFCGGYYSPHFHKTCVVCNGKGWYEKYEW